ncbi:MAG: protein-disulfide reductase DsbD domain-containing protein, partial [Myxococcota bacterium]
MKLLLFSLCCVLGVWLCTGSAPLWWFGVGVLGATGAIGWAWNHKRIATFWERLSEERRVGPVTVVWSEVLIEAAVVVLFVAIAAWMMPRALLGDRPINHDHTVHYFKAWQLWEHFLSQGKLFGWSHHWYAGYPPQYLYPFGADLWVLGVWALGLGALSLSAAYGVAIAVFWAFFGWSVYALGRATGSRWAGVLAGWFILTDRGAFRYGGWDFTLNWGVWPQALSLALGLVAITQLPAIMMERRWRPVGTFATFFGAAAPAHAALAPESSRTARAEVLLIADMDVAAPGQTVRLALHQTMVGNWHTYWENPGDSGLPTVMEWTAPEGVEIGPIQWPAPERLSIPPLMNYGFSGEAVLIQEMMIPADWPVGEPISLAVSSEWLICDDICVPEFQDYTLEIPTAEAATPDLFFSEVFERGEASWPT